MLADKLIIYPPAYVVVSFAKMRYHGLQMVLAWIGGE